MRRKETLDRCLEDHPLLSKTSFFETLPTLEDYMASQKIPNIKEIKNIILDLIENIEKLRDKGLTYENLSFKSIVFHEGHYKITSLTKNSSYSNEKDDIYQLGIKLKKLLMISEKECDQKEVENFYVLRFFLKDEFLDIINQINLKPFGILEKKLKRILIEKKILKSKQSQDEILELNDLTDYKNILFSKSDIAVLNDFFKSENSILNEVWKESEKINKLIKLSNNMTDSDSLKRPTFQKLRYFLKKIGFTESIQSNTYFFGLNRSCEKISKEVGESDGGDSVLISEENEDSLDSSLDILTLSKR